MESEGSKTVKKSPNKWERLIGHTIRNSYRQEKGRVIDIRKCGIMNCSHFSNLGCPTDHRVIKVVTNEETQRICGWCWSLFHIEKKEGAL